MWCAQLNEVVASVRTSISFIVDFVCFSFFFSLKIKMVFALLCVFCLVVILIKYISRVRYVESYVKNVKSISTQWPLIGNVPFFLRKSVQNIVEDGVQVILQHGTPMKAQIGPVTYVVVDRPEDMQTILTSTHCLDKPYSYDFFYASTGLIDKQCKPSFMCISVCVYVVVKSSKQTDFRRNFLLEISKIF